MNRDSTASEEVAAARKVPAEIWAVVVTYNRKHLLLGCLESLRRQTVTLSGIIIIDNASSDGTPHVLAEHNYIHASVPSRDIEAFESKREIPCITGAGRITIRYARLGNNEGGAGGFHEGIKRALDEGAEWIWLLDDDVEPEGNCLESLLRYQGMSACIHPRKRFDDGTFYEWEAYLDVMTGNDVFLYDSSFKNGKDICFVNIGCFEGMLISSSIVEKIGLPDKRFFIVFDDTIYGFLASRVTNVAYVRDAIMVKKIPLAGESFTDSFIYYSMRNYFLKNEYLNLYAPRPLYRTLRCLNLVAVFFRYLFHIVLYKKRKIKNLYQLGKGFCDGMTGRFMKRL